MFLFNKCENDKPLLLPRLKEGLYTYEEKERAPKCLSSLFNRKTQRAAYKTLIIKSTCPVTSPKKYSIFIIPNMSKPYSFSDKHELRKRNGFERLRPKSVIFLQQD